MQPLYLVIFTPDIWRWDAVRPMFATTVPGVAYCLSDIAVEHLRDTERRLGRALIASIEIADLAYWQGEDLDGVRVAVHHPGKLGDELIYTALYRQLAINYPAIDLAVVTRRPLDGVTVANRFVTTCPIAPWIPFDAAREFVWITPGLIGLETRGTSENIYHQLEVALGITLDVARPYVYLTGDDRHHSRENLVLACRNTGAVIPTDFWERYILVQTNASEIERTPSGWCARLRSIASALDGRYYVAVVGDAAGAAALIAEWEGPPIAGAYYFFEEMQQVSLTIRGMLALTESATAVVCPDSAFLHMAAAYDVPTVALWQDTLTHTAQGLAIPPPEARVATYDNVQVVGFSEPVERVGELLVNILGEG